MACLQKASTRVWETVLQVLYRKYIYRSVIQICDSCNCKNLLQLLQKNTEIHRSVKEAVIDPLATIIAYFACFTCFGLPS